MKNEKLISENDVKHVAELARLAISEGEKRQFTEDLNAILGYVKEIEEVEVNNYQAFDHYNLRNNQFREDKRKEIDEEEKSAIRKLFPEKEGNSLKVKGILSEEC